MTVEAAVVAEEWDCAVVEACLCLIVADFVTWLTSYQVNIAINAAALDRQDLTSTNYLSNYLKLNLDAPVDL
jgi:hypothetical protein